MLISLHGYLCYVNTDFKPAIMISKLFSGVAMVLGARGQNALMAPPPPPPNPNTGEGGGVTPLR